MRPVLPSSALRSFSAELNTLWELGEKGGWHDKAAAVLTSQSGIAESYSLTGI